MTVNRRLPSRSVSRLTFSWFWVDEGVPELEPVRFVVLGVGNRLTSAGVVGFQVLDVAVVEWLGDELAKTAKVGSELLLGG